MKKKILILTSVIALTAIGASTLTLIKTPETHNVISDPVTYTMTLDMDHKVTNYDQQYDPDVGEVVGTGTVKTDSGADIDLRLSVGEEHYNQVGNFIDYTDIGGEYVGYFELVSPLHGLIKMDYVADCTLNVSVGYSLGHYIGNETITITEGITSGTLDFAPLVSAYHVSPNSLKISTNADSESHVIYSIKLYYSCVDSGDPTEIVGNFIFETNGETSDSITITGFNMDGYSIPANKTLIIPNVIDHHEVTRIDEGVFDNVPWVEHIYIPFVGGTKWLDHPTLGFTFSYIFGCNKAHIQYQPIQQMNPPFGYEIHYIPKALKKISVTGCTYNMPNHHDIKCIPDYAFYGCNQMIEEIEFLCDFDEIYEGAFGNCSGLKELILPESCTKAGKGAFAGCANLTIRAKNFGFTMNDDTNPNHCGFSYGYQKTYEIDGIYYDLIKDGSWYGAVVMGGNKDLEYVNIPDSIYIEEIGRSPKVMNVANRAFEGHAKIKEVRFLSPNTDMGHYSFKDCYRATFLLANPYDNDWPKDWRNGGGRIYYNCDVHASEQIIDGYHYYPMTDSFLEADPLKKGCLFFDIDPEVGGVLDFASELEKVKEQDTEYDNYYTAYFLTYGFENNTQITSIKLPEKVVLPKYCFFGCTNLVDVYYEGTEEDWNNHLKEDDIGYNIFLNTQVTVIHVSDGSGGYVDINI